MSKLFFSRLSTCSALAALALCFGHFARADEVATRNGLEPADQSKVTRVLARERLRATPPGGGGTGAAAGAAGKSKDCTTNIGTVNTAESRPGVRGPRENITVIKAPVVNKC
jgi:hypothetical protein